VRAIPIRVLEQRRERCEVLFRELVSLVRSIDWPAAASSLVSRCVSHSSPIFDPIKIMFFVSTSLSMPNSVRERSRGTPTSVWRILGFPSNLGNKLEFFWGRAGLSDHLPLGVASSYCVNFDDPCPHLFFFIFVFVVTS
jgi:hypothetical protein